MLVDKNTIETLVGTKISNLDLYERAFTHKSALKEDETLSGRQEGFLTKARTKLVRGETLAKIATKMELYKWIKMDEKGMRNEWNHNPKILEDAFEALIGAIYMDMGLLHAKEFILRIYNDPSFVNMDSIMVDDNYKDHLMRYCQSNGLSLPVYNVGHHENGVFYIDVFVDGVCLGRGFAKNKKQAEQNAAKTFFYPPKLYNQQNHYHNVR